jgi:hypothetical protein
MSSSIKEGKLVRSSASQVQQFEACAQKWAMKYVLGIKEPQSHQQSHGESIHSQLEEYYKSLGEVLPTHDSVLLLLEKDIPKPQDGMLVEHPSDRGLGIRAADVEMIGRIDLVDPVSKGLAVVDIIDWKSTSNFKYNKTPAELEENIQLTVYGHWAFEVLGAKGVRYAHAYVGTKEEKAQVVWTRVLNRKEVRDAYTNIENTLMVMKMIPDVVNQLGIMAVPGNLKQCWAYGKPCHYQKMCPTFLEAQEQKAKQQESWADEFELQYNKDSGTFEAPTKEPDVKLEDLLEEPKPRATGINPPDSPDSSPIILTKEESKDLPLAVFPTVEELEEES